MKETLSRYQFKFASDNQAEEIAALVNSAYRGDEAKLGWTTETELLGGQRTEAKLVLELIHPPESQILTLYSESEKQIVACAHLEIQGPVLLLGMLAIRPRLQGRGLGRQLIGQAEVYARRWGCRTIEMSVISIRHELIAWYQRLGFTITERREPFPMQDPRFGIPKVDHLEFIIMTKTLAADQSIQTN
jgi:ribosomal protein S18 acetylase RimI-like enzyme